MQLGVSFPVAFRVSGLLTRQIGRHPLILLRPDLRGFSECCSRASETSENLNRSLSGIVSNWIPSATDFHWFFEILSSPY